MMILFYDFFFVLAQIYIISVWRNFAKLFFFFYLFETFRHFYYIKPSRPFRKQIYYYTHFITRRGLFPSFFFIYLYYNSFYDFDKFYLFQCTTTLESYTEKPAKNEILNDCQFFLSLSFDVKFFIVLFEILFCTRKKVILSPKAPSFSCRFSLLINYSQHNMYVLFCFSTKIHWKFSRKFIICFQFSREISK